MGRLIWIFGEVVVGVLLSGLASALGVPVVRLAGWASGPWVAWLSLAIGILAAVVAGEWLWRRRHRPRNA